MIVGVHIPIGNQSDSDAQKGIDGDLAEGDLVDARVFGELLTELRHIVGEL